MKDSLLLLSLAASGLCTVVYWIGVVWLVGGTAFAVLLAVRQESKIWSPRSLPSLTLWGMFKVVLFNFFWSLLCLVAAVLVILKKIVLLGRSDMAWDAHCIGERYVAHFCLRVFVGRVEIRGAENLPSNSNTSKRIPAPVYIANHASQMDIAAVYFLHQRFKWIAKESVKFIPGVGQLMALSQHVFIQRTTQKKSTPGNNNNNNNKKSVSNLFEKSNQAVMSGIPMFFYPQGTRWMAERLPFKDGAYIVATTSQSPLIPISIDIPHNGWNSAYPLNMITGGETPILTVTVHPSIPVTKDSDVDKLKQQSMDIIYSAVPTILAAEGQGKAAETKKTS